MTNQFATNINPRKHFNWWFETGFFVFQKLFNRLISLLRRQQNVAGTLNGVGYVMSFVDRALKTTSTCIIINL